MQTVVLEHSLNVEPATEAVYHLGMADPYAGGAWGYVEERDPRVDLGVTSYRSLVSGVRTAHVRGFEGRHE